MPTIIKGRRNLIQYSNNSYLNKFIELEKLRSILSLNLLSPVATTLNSTFQKVSFFDHVIVNEGPTFTFDQSDQSITVNRDCLAHFYGSISIEFSNSKTFTLALSRNGVPLTAGSSGTGLGSGKPIGLSKSVMIELKKGDVLTILGKSDDANSDLTFISSNQTLETVDIV